MNNCLYHASTIPLNFISIITSIILNTLVCIVDLVAYILVQKINRFNQDFSEKIFKYKLSTYPRYVSNPDISVEIS